MNLDKIKIDLKEIIHNNIYVSNHISDDLNEKYNNIVNYFNNSEHLIDDLDSIIPIRNNENYFEFDRIVGQIITRCKDDKKIEMLSNSISFKNSIVNKDILILIWNSIGDKNRLNYLLSKQKLNECDLLLINNELKKSSKNENLLLNEIINNVSFRSKIAPNSIDINVSKIVNKVDLSDFDLCSVFTKLSYTNALLRKCKNFDNFIKIYNKDNRIINLVEKGLLVFKSNEDEKIYNFILNNPNLIGKFNEKYLDLYSIVEINEFSKNKKIDGYSYSAVISKLYKYDKDKYLKLFAPSSLEKCEKRSLDVYPFDELTSEDRKIIFEDKNLFNKFSDVVRIEALNNYYVEDEILNNLRNDQFINEISPYALELLLNKMSFRSAFNMLQRKNILERIKYLNVKIDNSDLVFVKGFLDSPSLVTKSDSNMLFEMLLLLDRTDVVYYLELPYIVNVLTIYEIINLGIKKEIPIKEMFKIDIILERFNVIDLIEYINKSWEKNLDLSIFEDELLLKKIFNIEDSLVKKINVSEVNYLYETIRMKSLLSKQDIVCDVSSYRCVLIGYLVLGLDKLLDIINKGNSLVTLDNLMLLRKDIVKKKINNFKKQKELFFKDIESNTINELSRINAKNVDDFINIIQANTFLNNLIYLMVLNKYDSFNNIIDKMYSYVRYKHETNSKVEMQKYVLDFIEFYTNNMELLYQNDFDNIIKRNFKLKDGLIYKDRKRKGKDFFNKIKINLFVKALTNTDSDYSNYLNEKCDAIDLKQSYIKYLKNDEHSFEEILEHILIPLNNDRFDLTNCLDKLGIVKPDLYDKYLDYQNNLKNITKINMVIDGYKNKYSKEELLSILNYICYGNELLFKANKALLKKLTTYKDIISSIDDEVYVDKTADKLIYSYINDFYNIDEITEYNRYVAIVEKIIKKTTLFINKIFDDNKIIVGYNKEYLDYISNISLNYPLNNNNYELKRRVLSLSDISKTFEGYDINHINKCSSSLVNFLNNYLVYYLDGYLDDFINNFGIIINNFDKLNELAKGNLNVFNINDCLNKCNYNNNKYSYIIDKDIIECINSNDSYIVTDINKRLLILTDLFINSLKKINSSIPFVSYKEDNYEVKIIDNYSTDALKPISNSVYRVGMIGGDLLSYSLLCPDGCQIGIYKDGILLNKAIGVRNGNTLFINILEGQKNKNIIHLLKKFGNTIIAYTEKKNEPIEFITIVNNDVFSDPSGCVIDKTICPVINYPLFTEDKDYKDFINTKYVIRKKEALYTNYEDNYATLVANSLVVDNNNFKYYDAANCYLRKRNDVIKLGKNMDEVYYKKICLIMELSNSKSSRLDNFDTIYLGDDYVIIITGKKNKVYDLGYDERAKEEIYTILDLEKNKEQ